MFTTLLLAACANPSTTSPAPADWFYADQGGAIDWESRAFEGPDVTFHTVDDGLLSGPVRLPWLENLACGQPTRVTLAFLHGELTDVTTIPAAPCVADAVRGLDWALLDLDSLPVYATNHALVVFDVPGEEGEWSSS